MSEDHDWDKNYCDFCRSSLHPKWENDGHEDWCPVLEVKRLQADNERLRKALSAIADLDGNPYMLDHVRLAREALGE